MRKILARGIDTSVWQGSKVDYAKAKQDGISFVFLRIGYNQSKDTRFEADYASAVKAGLKVGVYYYTLSTSEAQGTTDATRVLGWLNNRHLDFPVAYDVEDSRQKKTALKTSNSKMYNAFKAKIEANGVYDAMLYSYESFYNNYFDKNLVTDDLWIAKYASVEPNVGRDVAIWQFSSAEIHTIYWNGKLDRNYMFVSDFQGSRTAMKKKDNNPYAEPTKTLKRTIPMTKGNDVKWVQWELYDAGILSYKDIDGYFGDKTKEAVKQFQKDHSLLVDGIVGPATRYAFKND